MQRIALREIKSHPWFLKNLPRELTEAAQTIYYQRNNPSLALLQSVEDIMKIVEAAKTPPPVSKSVSGFGWGGEDEDEDKEEEEPEVEEEEEEEFYDKQVKAVHASGEYRAS